MTLKLLKTRSLDVNFTVICEVYKIVFKMYNISLLKWFRLLKVSTCHVVEAVVAKWHSSMKALCSSYYAVAMATTNCRIWLSWFPWVCMVHRMKTPWQQSLVSRNGYHGYYELIAMVIIVHCAILNELAEKCSIRCGADLLLSHHYYLCWLLP